MGSLSAVDKADLTTGIVFSEMKGCAWEATLESAHRTLKVQTISLSFHVLVTGPNCSGHSAHPAVTTLPC